MSRKIIQTFSHCTFCDSFLTAEVYYEKRNSARYFYCENCGFKEFRGNLYLVCKLILEYYIEDHYLGDIKAIFGKYSEEGDEIGDV